MPAPQTPSDAPRFATGTGARLVLDAAGAAPHHPTAREAFLAALDDGWADPRRVHAEGRRAGLLLAGARESLAESLGARTEEVRLTPSLTSALHTAVTAVTSARRRVGPTVVASAVERQALLAAAGTRPVRDALVTVPVNQQGRLDLDAWAAAVRADGVALAALQHANGEVGTVQPVEEAHGVARAAGVPLLVDAGSSTGHVAVPGTWDLLAANPADWGAGSGVAVVAVRAGVRTRLSPVDDDPWAPGGVSVPAAVAAAVSLRAVLAERADAEARRRSLVTLLRRRVRDTIPDAVVLGPGPDHGGLPHVAAFSFLYVDGEALSTAMDRRGIAVGSGSACTSELGAPSHVLAAMGVLTQGNVRISLPHTPATPSQEDVERACRDLADAVASVRRMLGAEAW